MPFGEPQEKDYFSSMGHPSIPKCLIMTFSSSGCAAIGLILIIIIPSRFCGIDSSINLFILIFLLALCHCYTISSFSPYLIMRVPSGHPFCLRGAVMKKELYKLLMLLSVLTSLHSILLFGEFLEKYRIKVT